MSLGSHAATAGSASELKTKHLHCSSYEVAVLESELPGLEVRLFFWVIYCVTLETGWPKLCPQLTIMITLVIVKASTSS